MRVYAPSGGELKPKLKVKRTNTELYIAGEGDRLTGSQLEYWEYP